MHPKNGHLVPRTPDVRGPISRLILKLTEPVAERNLRTSLAGLGLDRRVYFKGEEGMSRKISSVCSLTFHSHLKSWRTVTKIQITRHPEWGEKFCHFVDIVENYNLETDA